ncbi:MAG: hypothetical protein O3A91_04235 [Proteobacteria bacterium]|nr:hypothetical protein [Pseudomonadota bacterium]
MRGARRRRLGDRLCMTDPRFAEVGGMPGWRVRDNMASMTIAARWIRQGTVEPRALQAAIAGLALAQSPRAAPIVLWASAATAADGEWLQVEEGHHAFALIAPARFAPGRASRRIAWATASAIAAYRQLGVRAYANCNDIWLNGRLIARGAAATLGECVMVSGSFLPGLPGAGFEERVLEAVFRTRLEAQHGWQFDTSWADEAERAAIADALSEQEQVR